MKITIAAVGKIKEGYWEAAIAEYTPDGASPALVAQRKEREGESN